MTVETYGNNNSLSFCPFTTPAGNQEHKVFAVAYCRDSLKNISFLNNGFSVTVSKIINAVDAVCGAANMSVCRRSLLFFCCRTVFRKCCWNLNLHLFLPRHILKYQILILLQRALLDKPALMCISGVSVSWVTRHLSGADCGKNSLCTTSFSECIRSMICNLYQP